MVWGGFAAVGCLRALLSKVLLFFLFGEIWGIGVVVGALVWGACFFLWREVVLRGLR